MAQLTHAQYDALERAIADGSRLAIFRRGSEFIVIARRLGLDGNREFVEAMHPTTGESITLYIDEVDSIEVVK
jgi:hypothetical protein